MSSLPRATVLRTLFGVLAGMALLAPGPDATRAQAADGLPVFSDSVSIDNPWFPVDPGAVKVFIGRARRRRITQVETHPTETRTFIYGGQTVVCRIVVKRTFLRGAPTAIETGYYAQTDDGNVYCFGETDVGDDLDDDNSDDGPSGWIVGQVQPTDPEDTVSVEAPTMRMSSNPIRGDEWITEDLGPGTEQKYRVLTAGRPVRVEAGRFESSVRLRDMGTSRGDRETLWFAEGAGLVKASGDGSRVQLVATSLRRR